jgi:hypothetical protein
LDRSAGPLRFRHHADDLHQQGIAANALGAHNETARRIDGRSSHLVAGLFFGRHRLAGDHRFIDRAVAVEHHPVDRHLLAGTHAQAVAGGDGIEGNVLVAAIRAQSARALGRQVEQGADRAARLETGAQLENLAEENQRNDDGRRLEVERHLSVWIAERGGKDAGRQGSRQAVEVGDAGAERDQREHVEPAIDDRGPAAPEERPAAPQHDRRPEDQLHPDRKARGEEDVERGLVEMLGHDDGQQRQRKRDTDPEAPRQVAKFGVRRISG